MLLNKHGRKVALSILKAVHLIDLVRASNISIQILNESILKAVDLSMNGKLLAALPRLLDNRSTCHEGHLSFDIQFA